MKLSSSNQERNNDEQLIAHNKDNTNINNINNKSEISIITNCIDNNFENINYTAMKNTVNMKELVNENVDMESVEQIKENPEKDVRTEENIIRNVSKNFKKCIF